MAPSIAFVAFLTRDKLFSGLRKIKKYWTVRQRAF